MVTRAEAALMSTAVYRPDAGNDVSVPGWSVLNQVVQSPYNFGATAYMRGNEIVIAYRGTDEKADFVWGNIPAALGLPSAEVKEAMEFYVRVRQQYPNAAISLTGHSLGAGLASLMAVYFNVEARVFDNAPFAVSAQDGLLLQHYQHYLEQLGFANAQFDAYVANYNALFAQRLAKVVSTDRVDGEVLEIISPDILKLSPQVTEYQTYGNAASDDLHSIRLLTTLITSKKFADAVRESEDILPLAFAKDRTIKSVGFWTRLVQGITKDGVASLDKFADDLVAIEDGGKMNSYRKALTMAAIEYYYWSGGVADNALFTVKNGGVAVDLSDINSDTLDSTSMLSNVVRAEAQPDELDLLPDLKAMLLWYIQQGNSGLDITDAEAGDTVVVGGSGSDHAVTGEGDDVLIGNGGKDDLDGGEGNDLLLGGAEADRLNGGGGNDTVLGGTGDDDINGGEGSDSLLGGSGKDILSGGEGADTLRGEAGDDALLGYVGNDGLEGGEGDDRLDGGADNDTLRGEAGNDTLTGDDGTDELVGGAGDDILYGNDGKGGDVLTGGIGRDIYHADDGDTIYDEDGQGEIWLNGKRLTEATRKKGETLYHDDAGNTYQLQGDRLLINDPLVVTGFSSGKLGIVLKEDDDDDDPHDPLGKDLFMSAMQNASPVVLDLDGGGIATRGIGAGAFFDFDGNGFAERTGWVEEGEGILVRDLNGDGRITTGAELFGDKTALPGGANAADGYVALSALDSDKNGILDKRDTAWTELKVWRDVNGDGVSAATEMVSLDDAEVKTIKLSTTTGTRTDLHLNDHKLVSTFTRVDGSEGQTADIWFRINVSSTRYETPVTLSADLLQLPDLKGTGNVANLLQVMAGDTSGRLEAVVRQYAASSMLSSQTELLKTLILTWAGVQDVDPFSRGGNVKDARVLEALEKLYGTEFFSLVGWGSTPGPGGSAQLESAFTALLADFGAALDSQTRFKPWFGQIHMHWDTETRSLVGNLDDVAAVVKTQQFDSVEQAGVVLTSFIAALRITHSLGPFSVKAFLSALGPLGAQLTSTIVSAWEGTGVTEGNDRITGKETNDLLFGVGGNDYINGGGGADTVNGGGGDDQLDGDEGDDVLSGGVGDDVLRGAAGNDTIMFGVGDGRDTVQNGVLRDVDRLQFLAGITAENITVQRNWDNLTLSRSGSTDSVVILNFFAANSGQTIVQFADGVVWDAPTIQAMLTLAGTANADYLIGFEGADTILGSGGDDTILGRGENDALLGGDGDDNIDGGTGNDSLSGGAGNDVLNGGAGADVYLYGIGDGRDAITDVYYGDGSINEVRFDDTIIADQLQITRDRSGLIVSIANQPRLTINNDATLRLVFRFADGVTWDSRSIIQRVEATDGDDHLEADSATLLDGADGNDTLDGSSGDDTLVGGTGEDVMNGRGGNDVFLYSLGGGMDAIRGWTNGTLRLGEGIQEGSVLARSERSGRFLYFADGGKVKFGTTQNLRVEFQDGTVWDTAHLDAKLMVGTADDDMLYATSVALPFEGKAGNDTLQGSSADNTLIGGEGDDTLTGGGGNDVIRFARGDGQDVINSNMGGIGDIVIEFSPSIVAEDIALVRDYGLAVTIRIRGSTDSITLMQTSALPAIRFADGTTWNSQMVWDRSMLGTEFDDYLTAGVGRTSLDGQAGNDNLQGDASSNTLIGGDGNDTLSGGLGDDVFVYSRGQDNISDFDVNNILRFDAGIRTSDIHVEIQGGRVNLFVRDRGTVSFDTGISRFEFADGTVWTYADMSNQRFIGGDGNDTLQSDGADRVLNGGGGDDTLYAGAGSETLIGGTGDDLLSGSGGNDVFLYASGDGNDRIQVGYGANDHSILRLQSGIDPTAVQVARNGLNVVLTIAPDASQITLVGWLNPSSRLSQLAFADGTIWNAEKILNLFTTGTSADDVMVGTFDDNLLIGEGGNDRLSDWEGNDTIVGGTGDDWMQGGSGNNLYLYRLGDGLDEINDGGGIDELRFDATISVSDVSVRRDGSNILLSIADSGAIKISSYFDFPLERIVFADGTVWTAAQLLATPMEGTADNDRLYGSAFGDSVDGGAGDDYIVGQDGADTITGGIGNDNIVGGAGGDVYRFARGDGRDMIYDVPGERDVVQLGVGISAGDLKLRRDADNVYLSISGTEDGITFTGWTDATPRIDRVEFADGTSLSGAAIWTRISQPSLGDDWLTPSGEAPVHALEGNDTVTGGSENDALYGDQGDDSLVGNSGADLIVGGRGNDTMYGGAGDDVYLVGPDDDRDSIVDAEGANVVRFASGVLPGQVLLYRVGNGALIVQLPGQQNLRMDIITVAGKEALPRFEFSDGTIWDVATVSQMLLQGDEGNDWIVGTDAGDNMSGGGGSDSMRGGQGDDTLHGGSGYDFLVGGEDDDTYLYERGDGFDVIAFEKEGKDTIQFGAGITAADLKFSRQYGALQIQVGSSADDTLLIQDWFGSASWQNINVRFAGGEVLTAEQMAVLAGAQGTEGDDSLSGGAWNDTLSGGGGNDHIYGGLGDDLLSGGTGNDTLSGDWGHDVYLFNRGDGRDTVYALSSSAEEDTDTVRFGAGITADEIQVYRSWNSIVLAIAGTGDALTIWPWFVKGAKSGVTRVEFADGTAWSPDDMLRRLVFPITDGDDRATGFEDDDLINGKGGDDSLFGSDGNDTLIGGRGNDYLAGEAGSDVYRYAQGDGSDHYKFEIGGGADGLEFGEGVFAADIVMSRDLTNLYLRLEKSGDSIVVEGWFGEDGYAQNDSALSRIVFADGTTWTPASTALQISAMTAGDLFVLGGAADDTLLGYGGNDVLHGGAGNDTLDAGDGTNRASGGAGNDVYRYSGGVLTIDDWSVAADEQDGLEISGVGAGGLALHNYSGDLAIADNDGNLIIRIVGYFETNSGGELKSGTIAFADGTIWNRAMVVGMLPQLVATEDGDELRLTTPGVIDGLGGADRIVGVSRSTLHGGDGDDFLTIVGVGNDAILHGDNGNDRLQLDSGARDLLYGDAGDDSMQVRKGSGVTMDGGDGADFLELDEGDNNWLYGASGNDAIHVDSGGQSNHGYGGEGDDTLMGADGSSVDLYGDDGDDRLEWERGSGHRLHGGEGNDRLQISRGSDHLLDGGAGNDALLGFSDNATLLGGDGADTMQANNTGAWMDGGSGNDLMNIYSGNSTLIGGEGDDTLDGSNSNMVMRGGAGKDKLSTNGSFDLLDGGADDDSVYVGGGSDVTILGSEGNDTLTLGAGARNLLDGGDGDDILQVGAYQANVVRGGAGADIIGVNYGSAQIEGGSGNDTIKTGTTNQFVAGGTGDDLITVQNGADIVAFNLGDGKDTIDGTDVTATLSLGGVQYADLLFSREQTDLILKVGDSDQLRLKDWYNADDLHRTVSQLQFILDGGAEYDAASTDALRNQRTTLFNFQQLVDTFDSALLADPTLNAWSVTSALISAHLGGGNSDAIGGELAYQYGRSGNLDGLTMQASVALLAAPEFGASRQQFQPLTS